MSAQSNHRPLSRPFGVTVLAILQVISAFQYIVTSLILFTASSENEAPDRTKSNMLFLLGIIFFVLGLLSFWLARGYVKGFEWARHRGRTIAALAIVLVILELMFLPPKFLDNPGWTIVFNLAVVIYLGRPRIRAFFKARSQK